MQKTEVLIVGAGMAGASLAYFLAPHRQVTLLERESQPGYHATGRSAALYSETYGNAPVRAITTASKAFYFAPPEGFSPYPLVTPRGSLSVGGNDDRETLQRAFDERKALVPNIEWWSQADILQRVPILKPEAAVYGVYEPDAMDMDVHGIHQGFLRGAKAAGAQLLCDAVVEQIAREGNAWRIKTTAGEFLAEVVVNAAGAWCDELARMAGVAPIGLQPMRRTAFMCDVPAGCDSHAWPMVMDANEGFYLKPDAGMLLVSPANADPVEPQDVQPEELDVAIAVDRVETATTLQIRRVQRKWAGLRSFVADKTPVVGFAPDAPGFFWLAGQGGYGIQTAPAMGELSAALVQHQPVPAALTALGVTEATLAPGRPMA
ncbi:MAG: FAD-binding oxidoreductase [Rhodoferax sp.]|nr:FAD-binding oxidoreductase [Rhodoferax sp.]OIP24539.1 MAG: FAD-dependent oxidoreductase [Comamonadaceae bacterium CG2_30_60_41]PIW10682.1 MAG: FAD-dependent oxidoreductase [Comamonadaceae bacterium CG17_big_fil_post_rev_8_21_14_2_50_60_13]PIY24214.1 MAG: FAD-dependent oxidoreductase [Comamonadaceae bacterium CG_4_10_14_3_um_filter_60_75]PJC12029.1 MAG: FAD-dependent oxidoreductase [Comamonadaceae bacterium CG_4_9_14_0_8_um_filter_60_18]